jgi:hypothetical protein
VLAVRILGKDLAVALKIQGFSRAAERSRGFDKHEAIYDISKLLQAYLQKVQFVEKEETVENHRNPISYALGAMQSIFHGDFKRLIPLSLRPSP